MVYRALSTLIAASTLFFIQIPSSQAACERISKSATGASRSIALTNAREALLGLQSSKFSGGPCKPMALRCKLEDNQWRCTARRDCCTEGTQFIDADIDRSGARRCKTLSSWGVGETRDEARKEAATRLDQVKLDYAKQVGVTFSRLSCDNRSWDCTPTRTAYRCDVSRKCCNR